MLLPVTFDENTRRDTKSRIKTDGSSPFVRNVRPTVFPPVADTGTRAHYVSLKRNPHIHPPQRLFYKVFLPALFFVAQRVIIVECAKEGSALYVRANAEAFMTDPMQIPIIENRSAADGINADGSVCETGAVDNADAPVNALFFPQSRPEHQTGLRKKHMFAYVQQRDCKINPSFDVFNIFPEYPAQRRVELETFVKQCESALTQGIFKSLDDQSRSDRSQVQRAGLGQRRGD